MITLIKNAQVYAPAPLGKKDILIVGEKICRMADKIEGYDDLPDVQVYDLEGKRLVPGYIDMHVHVTGGGGEQGPTSRVPESQLSVFVVNGITTVVGMLGTDGITRSIENLVAKARESVPVILNPTLGEILEADAAAREIVLREV